MTTKKQKRDGEILRHGLQLKAIFPTTQMGPVSICKALRRVENRMHKLAEDNCNYGVDDDKLDKAHQSALNRVFEILEPTEEQKAAIFINGDPRGYALKIEDSYVRSHSLDIYRDWGGYGILAPEFDGN